ncbi:MAG TPA: DUF167 domain-containing protein [Candidatus Binatia bacterium]|nr:DUF167 domain-containing protein [Candidatus Binatia bacterium]
MARKLWVVVKPLAKVEAVAEKAQGDFVVSVRPPAKNGQANARLIELLAAHFGTAKTHVRIVRGHSSRKKLIEIE